MEYLLDRWLGKNWVDISLGLKGAIAGSVWEIYANAFEHSNSSTNAALNRFQTQALDGYDLFILEAIHKANSGQVKVLTDDMDYATVPNIQLFTSNYQAIRSAKAQGKLFRR